MEDDKGVKGLSEEDREKLSKLLDLLRSSAPLDEDEGFLCTHCHCRVCTTAKSGKRTAEEKQKSE